MCIASTLMDKVDPASWYMRKQGWAGMTNPANIIDSRVEGALGIGNGKTATENRAVKMGVDAQNKAHQASSVSGPAGHVKAIAARKARVG